MVLEHEDQQDPETTLRTRSLQKQTFVVVSSTGSEREGRRKAEGGLRQLDPAHRRVG